MKRFFYLNETTRTDIISEFVVQRKNKATALRVPINGFQNFSLFKILYSDFLQIRPKLTWNVWQYRSSFPSIYTSWHRAISSGFLFFYGSRVVFLVKTTLQCIVFQNTQSRLNFMATWKSWHNRSWLFFFLKMSEKCIGLRWKYSTSKNHRSSCVSVPDNTLVNNWWEVVS